jgi:hypothetical protein
LVHPNNGTALCCVHKIAKMALAWRKLARVEQNERGALVYSSVDEKEGDFITF